MAATVTINGVDRTSVVLWRTVRITEAGAVQKVGRIEFEIIDKLLAFTFANDQTVVVTDGAEQLFDGKLVSVKRRSIHSPTGSRKRIYVLVAADNNTVADERVVGAPDGSIYSGPDAQGNFTAIDPAALSQSSDKGTVEWLFDQYVSEPVMDATTYVEEFIPPEVGYEHIIYWDRVYLRQALDELAAFAGVNVVWWIRGTDVIWTRMPDPSDPDDPLNAPPLIFPAPPGTPQEAPYAITDNNPNGTTTVGSEASEYEEEIAGRAGATNVYIRGATDVVYNGGVPIYGGSGWYPDDFRYIGRRQAMIDARNSDTVARRDAIGARAVALATRSRRKGFSVVSGYNGWHSTQIVTITDAALGLDGARFMIQRVQIGFKTPTVRTYRIEWGDGPTSRLSDGPPAARSPRDTYMPAPSHAVLIDPLSPIAGATETKTGQLVNGAGEPWRIQGKVIQWELELTDAAGDPAVDGDAGVSPTESTTDANGKAETVVTYGSIGGIAYRLKGKVVVL